MECSCVKLRLAKIQVSVWILLFSKGCDVITEQKYICDIYRGADKSLVRSGRKQATATEDFDVHISYLYSELEEY